VDKMTLAALDAILVIHQSGRATSDIPTARMLAAPVEEVRARATAFAARLAREAPSLHVAVVEGTSAAGGGAAPTAEIPTALLRMVHRAQSAPQLAARLRTGEPAVVARIAGDALVVDLRTVGVEEEEALAGALARAATATEIDRRG
jgi:L-seryl-tRNA(Ser) seleniumtransferase